MIATDAGRMFEDLEAYTAELAEQYGCEPAEVPVVLGERWGLMDGDALEPIREHMRQMIDEQRELHANAGNLGRDFLASESRRWDLADERIEHAARFITEATDAAERARASREHLAEQRQPFTHMLGGRMKTENHSLEEFLRHGGQPYVDLPLEFHDLTKGASPGSQLIPTSFSAVFFQALTAAAAIRDTNVTVMSTGSGENILVPKATAYGTAALIAEGASITESDATLAQVTVGAYKYAAFMQATREIVEDSAFDISSFVAKSFGESIGAAIGAAYITGTGSSQPEGIANAPTAGVTLSAGQTTTITSADSLIDLFFSVGAKYRKQAFWLMNDTTLAIVRKLKASGTGEYILDVGLGDAQPRILGSPVLVDQNMAVPAANAFTIAFGDFSKYFLIRDAGGLRVERSDDFAFQSDLVSYRGVFRTDSKQVLNGASGAVKFLRQSAT